MRNYLTSLVSSIGPKLRRTVEEAKLPSPTLLYQEPEDIAARALEDGKRDTRDLLARIGRAGSSPKALAAIRRELNRDLPGERDPKKTLDQTNNPTKEHVDE